MAKFKVGDRVKASGSFLGITDAIGTVIAIDTTFIDTGYLVEFDDYVDGHTGHGDYTGKEGHCWWFDLSDDIVHISTSQRGKYVKYYPSVVTNRVGAH